MRHRGTLLVLLVLAAGALAVYLQSRGGDEGPGVDAATDRPTTHDPEAALQGREAQQPDPDPAADAGSDADEGARGGDAPADSPAPTVYVLACTFEGNGALPTKVELMYANEYATLTGRTAEAAIVDRRLRVRVDELLGPFDQSWVAIRLDADGYLRVDRRVAKSEFVVNAEGIAIANVTIELEQTGWITGRVVDELDKPIGNAAVGLIVRTKPHVAPRILDSIATNEEGRYRLRAVENGTYELVAAAAGRLPVLLRVEVQRGRGTAGPVIRLTKGARVSGRLLGLPEVIGGAWMGVYPADDGGGDVFVLVQFPLALRGDRVLHYPQFAETDAEGRFAIAGLAPGKVSIQIEQGGGHTLLHSEALESVSPTVTAPAEGVEIRLALARIVMEVRIDGKPVAKVSTSFAAVGRLPDADEDSLEGMIVWRSMGGRTGEDGRTSMTVSADADYAVSAEAEGRERVVRRVRSPAAGGESVVVIDLVKAENRRTLTVGFAGIQGNGIRSAYVAVLSGDRVDPKRVVPAGRQIDVTDARCTVELDHPGTHLYVHPGARYAGSVGYWLPVILPIPKADRLTVPLRQGCGLEIDVRAPGGGAARTQCRIESADGVEQGVWFVGRKDGGAYITSSAIEMPSAIHPPLPEGRYTIVLSRDGEEPLRHTVLLTPGKATHVRLTYPPQ